MHIKVSIQNLKSCMYNLNAVSYYQIYSSQQILHEFLAMPTSHSWY